MTVGVDRSAVETALCGGSLGCPVAGCGGRLAPWGWARARGVRGEGDRVRLRPRRSVCVDCRRTQVLLPASVPPGGRTGHQGRVHRLPAGTTADPDRCREQRRGQFPGRLGPGRRGPGLLGRDLHPLTRRPGLGRRGGHVVHRWRCGRRRRGCCRRRRSCGSRCRSGIRTGWASPSSVRSLRAVTPLAPRPLATQPGTHRQHGEHCRAGHLPVPPSERRKTRQPRTGHGTRHPVRAPGKA